MNAATTVNELISLREGVVGFALSKTLTRLLGAPELLSGRLGDRPFIEKILAPQSGETRNWSTQQMLKERSIYVLHRGKCLEDAWFECAIVLAVVGHLVLLDLSVDGSEDAAERRYQALLKASEPQVADYAAHVFRGLIGLDGLIQDPAT